MSVNIELVEYTVDALINIKIQVITPKLLQLRLRIDQRIFSGWPSYQKIELIPKLLNLLQDNDPTVRLNAAEVLGNLKVQQAIPQLLLLLQDNNSIVRSNAAKALGNLKVKQAIPQLLLILHSNDSWESANAAKALSNLKAQQAIPQLLLLLQNNAPPSSAFCCHRSIG